MKCKCSRGNTMSGQKTSFGAPPRQFAQMHSKRMSTQILLWCWRLCCTCMLFWASGTFAACATRAAHVPRTCHACATVLCCECMICMICRICTICMLCITDMICTIWTICTIGMTCMICMICTICMDLYAFLFNVFAWHWRNRIDLCQFEVDLHATCGSTLEHMGHQPL